MEYLAKILYEERDGDFWKYEVLNIETGEKDWIHNHEKLDHFPSLPGKIKLFPNEDNQEKKFCQLFDQDIFETEKEYQEVEEKLTLIELREKLEKGVSEADNVLADKKPKLIPQLVVMLRKYLTQKKIANVYQITERTVRNLENRAKNPKKKHKKRGRPLKIIGYNLSLLKTFANPTDKKNKITKTQQEVVEEYRKIGLDLNQSTISRTLTREKQTNKVGAKEYYELNIEKVKQFVLDNYWIYSYSNCFSLDEFGFYANEVHRFACSRKGCRAKKVQLGEKGTRFTVILCVQNIAGQGEIKVSYKVIKNIRKKGKQKKKDKKKEKKGTTAIDLHDFIERINFPNNGRILLDNAKIHHAVKSLIKANRLPIKELAVKKGVILVYLPARAPMIQPAELFINAIKNFIKKKLREFIGGKQLPTDEEVEDIIKQAMEELEKKDLTKNFLHCRDKLNVKPNYKSGK